MEYINYGITYTYNEYYLPTKRHKNEVRRVMTSCHDLKVRKLSAEEFPVAMKVTDYGQTNSDFELDTIEVRWDGEHLYKEYRIESGNGKGSLIPVEDMSTILKPMDEYPAYIKTGKEYDAEKSVIIDDTRKAKIDVMEGTASGYVIFDNKIWIQCGQPYYKVQTFGIGGINGSTGFFIEWTYHDMINKSYYLANQRKAALEHAVDVAVKRGDARDVEEYRDKKGGRNIEILIPESYTLKRDLASKDLVGYYWDDDEACYVKEYGQSIHDRKWLVRFEYNYDRYLAIMYAPDERYLATMSQVWFIAGQLLEDIRDMKFENIKEMYCVELDKDFLQWIKEYSEVAE